MLLQAVVKKIKQGEVGVLPTDTLYGLVASAFSKKAVQKIYRLKKRNPKKPLIILISSFKDLEDFGVLLDKNTRLFLKKVWPGQVSVILGLSLIGQNKIDRTRDRTNRLSYLKPRENTLAFRLPKPQWLRSILQKTGPLVAPSCNPEGLKPAQTISQAKKYFGDKLDFYFDQGRLSGKPSTLVALEGDIARVVRQGRTQVKNEKRKPTIKN